jgi:hypothetical protein
MRKSTTILAYAIVFVILAKRAAGKQHRSALRFARNANAKLAHARMIVDLRVAVLCASTAGHKPECSKPDSGYSMQFKACNDDAGDPQCRKA